MATRAAHRMSDINVTPFVDVMLVLLVVFMIAAPLISTSVPVRLPNVESKPITDQQERLAITLDGEGRLFLMDTAVEPDALVPRLQAIVEAKQETRISLRADADQRYGAVLDLMEQIRIAGFAKIDLVFDPLEVARRARSAQTSADARP